MRLGYQLLPVIGLEWSGQDLFGHLYQYPISLMLRNQAYLRHHSPPSHKVDVAVRPQFLLVADDGIKQVIEMIISGIIKLVEALEPFREVAADAWRIIVGDAGIVRLVLMLRII